MWLLHWVRISKPEGQTQFKIGLAHWEDLKARNSRIAPQMEKDTQKWVKIKKRDTNQMVIGRKWAIKPANACLQVPGGEKWGCCDAQGENDDLGQCYKNRTG